jgi:lysophospholipase L1-like esterase
MLRRLLLASALLLGTLPLGAATHLPPAAMPISRLSTPWWKARFEQKQAELAHMRPTLLWLGDSITEDWEHDGPQPWNDFAPIWRRFYGDRNAINLGFKGDATSHLLWRIEHGETDNMAPRAAIVLIGANNFGLVHWSAADTLIGIDTVITELHRRLPATKILLLGVLPSIRSPWVSQQTDELNHALAAHDWHGAPVTFMDVSRLFLRDGAVDRTKFLDIHLTPPDPPLHPTPETQEQIAAAIEPTLATMLGDRNHAR